MAPPTTNFSHGLPNFPNMCSIMFIAFVKYSDTKPQNRPSSTAYGMRVVMNASLWEKKNSDSYPVNEYDIEAAATDDIINGNTDTAVRSSISNTIIKSIPATTISKKELYIAPQIQSYSCLSKSSKLFYTKEAFDTWEDAMLSLADIHIDARCSLEKLHSFERRGLLARPIISKKDKNNIPPDVRRGRHPKFLKMVVSQLKNGRYCGIILTLPIQFYESKNAEEYNRMVEYIHNFLSENMIDKTNDLIGELQ